MADLQNQLSDDVLKGAKAIAEFMGDSQRRVFYMLERGDLPAFKLAGRWTARKSTLLAHFARLEARATERGENAA